MNWNSLPSMPIQLSCHDADFLYETAGPSSFHMYVLQHLSGSALLQGRAPLTGESLIPACSDGLVLAALLNYGIPDTIDERVLVTEMDTSTITDQHLQNISLVINSAKGVGCRIRDSMTPDRDIAEGIVHYVVGLLWQIIYVLFLSSLFFALIVPLRVLSVGWIDGARFCSGPPRADPTRTGRPSRHSDETISTATSPPMDQPSVAAPQLSLDNCSTWC